jgi:protease I
VVKEVLDFTREAYMKGKIIAAICHGPQVLISAGLVTGKVVTSYAAVWDDLRNAGAKLLDVPAVIDGRIVTGRVPDDLPEFVRAIIEALTGKEYVSALR